MYKGSRVDQNAVRNCTEGKKGSGGSEGTPCAERNGSIEKKKLKTAVYPPNGFCRDNDGNPGGRGVLGRAQGRCDTATSKKRPCKGKGRAH